MKRHGNHHPQDQGNRDLGDGRSRRHRRLRHQDRHRLPRPHAGAAGAPFADRHYAAAPRATCTSISTTPPKQAAEVPAVAPRRRVEGRREVLYLEAHRVGRGRRHGLRGEQGSHRGHQRGRLFEGIVLLWKRLRPQQVRAEGGLGDLQLAEEELLEGAPRGHLAAQRSRTRHAPGPILLLAAGEVADDERPAQRPERRVAGLAGPVEDVQRLAGGERGPAPCACRGGRRGPGRPRSSASRSGCGRRRSGRPTARSRSPWRRGARGSSRRRARRARPCPGRGSASRRRRHATRRGRCGRASASARRCTRPSRRTGSGRTPGSTGSRSRATACPGPRPARDGPRRCSRRGSGTGSRARSRGRIDPPRRRAAARRPSLYSCRRRRPRAATPRSDSRCPEGCPRRARPWSRRGRTTRAPCGASPR